MKKEETQELNELSEKVFGNPYAWRKLRKQGLVTERTQVNKGSYPPAYVARRMPLSVNGCRHYMLETLRMREEIKNENRR